MIRYRLIQAPGALHALSRMDENGDYDVYVNEALNEDARERAIEHELRHIRNGSLSRRDLTANELEELDSPEERR